MKTKTVLKLVALAVFIDYCSKQRKNNFPAIHVSKELPLGYNAVTVPPIGIFVKESQSKNQNLLNHELIHWKQFQREGLIPYALNYLFNATTKGYDQNPYELEARQIESEFCRNNYTECVRHGIALTLFDPNFRR